MTSPSGRTTQARYPTGCPTMPHFPTWTRPIAPSLPMSGPSAGRGCGGTLCGSRPGANAPGGASSSRSTNTAMWSSAISAMRRRRTMPTPIPRRVCRAGRAHRWQATCPAASMYRPHLSGPVCTSYGHFMDQFGTSSAMRRSASSARPAPRPEPAFSVIQPRHPDGPAAPAARAGACAGRNHSITAPLCLQAR